MIIAVTGANGALAKKLIPFLESFGHETIKISTSLNPDSQSNFSYQDLQSQNIPKKVDVLIHLASINNDKSGGFTPADITKEVDLTRIVLNAMPSMGCSKLIFFSTYKIYGDASSLVAYDETASSNPICSYGKAKLPCVSLICDQEANNLNSIIFRLPPILDQSSISKLGRLMRFAKKKNPILSLPEGETNQRSFASLTNIKFAMKYMLEEPSHIQGSQIFNLADDSFISINGLLRALSGKDIYIAPKTISRLVFCVPFLEKFLLNLYGNFVIDNSKLQNEMGVKLASTIQVLANGETS